MKIWQMTWTGCAVCLILFLSALSCSAVAPTPPDEVIQDEEAVAAKSYEIFQKLFFSDSYNSLKCQENIYNLLAGIRHANLDLSQVKVIFIFDKDHDQLIPTKQLQQRRYGIERPDIETYRTRRVPSRNPPPNRFRYHVFAVIRNQVLDFDYTDSPVFPTVEEYVTEMFSIGKRTRQEKRALFNRLILRVISSENYLREHPQHPSYYLFDLDRKYPSQTLEDYLQQSASSKPKEASVAEDLLNGMIFP